MAVAYADVCLGIGIPFEVIGRGDRSADAFEAETGLPVRRGGLDQMLSHCPPPSSAIVAIPIDGLAAAAGLLVESGVERILLEKPGGVDSVEIRKLARNARDRGAEVLVGYNRRFLTSAIEARRLIEADGGAMSCKFEFGERTNLITDLNLPARVLSRWFLANSSHVVDLAFHLVGQPAELSASTSGELDWHPAASQFHGSGITDQGVTFSYRADWSAPASWRVEVTTARRTLIFQPLESLRMMMAGTDSELDVDLANSEDLDHKPGLLNQVRAFLVGDDRLLCGIEEQAANCDTYDRMAGYDDVVSSILVRKATAYLCSAGT